jgi:DNA-binding NarL/FixJ family response regulator
MSISISSTRLAPAADAAKTSSKAAPARSSQLTGNVSASGDTVRLSEAQQVYQLYNQGQQIPQIAAALNLPVSSVNLYLGVTGGGS